MCFCNTRSAPETATIPLQCCYIVLSVFYNVSWFNFNFKSFFEYYLNQVLITICKGTSNFLIQVSQYKFIVLKIMSIKIFGEFMEFFLKGLDPFQIQTKFKLDFLPEFLIQRLLGIWTSSQKESCSFWIYLHRGKIWKYLGIRKFMFDTFGLELLKSIWKPIWLSYPGPAHLNSAGTPPIWTGLRP